MKKLMITAAASIAAVGAFAVESANIVGYNTTSIKGGKMNLLCVSWETVGNTQGKATLNDVMDTSLLTSYSADGETAGDYIDTWNMEAGNWGPTYYYVDQPEAWEDTAYTDTWADGDLVPCNPAVEPGSAFWLYSSKDIASFSFRGQVMTDGVAYTLTAGKMNLCANPYPTVLNLNDKTQVTLTGKTSYGADGETVGDYIDTWDLASGNWGPTYYYVDQAVAWEDAAYADTWTDGDLVPVESTEIPVGAGFWYNAKAPVTMTFTSPIGE